MMLVELKKEFYEVELFEEKDTGGSTEPFGKTKVFRKFYGNYCGPGNAGGEPIDCVDNACKNHDMCYHYRGRACTECDKKFVYELDTVLKHNKLNFKQRTAAQLMKAYFTRTLNKKSHPNVSNS